MDRCEDIYRAVDAGVELREAGDGSTLTGHFARFNQWTEIDSVWEGNFMERIAPGAFKKTFQEGRDKIKVLFQHGKDPQLGDKPLGAIRSLKEDNQGAYYEVDLLRKQDGELVDYVGSIVPGLEKGLYGASFRFSVVKEDFNREAERSDYNPKGIPERTITEAKVMEFGPVTFPAYAGATAGVRSTTVEYKIPQDYRDYVDATFYRLLAETRAAALGSEEPDPDRGSTSGIGEPPHSAEEANDNQEEAPRWLLTR